MPAILSHEEVFGGNPGGAVLPHEYVFGAKPKPIGAEAQGDFLREELKNADWGTRNIAAFGTALSDLYERGKQLVGNGDRQAIEANQIMRDEAPVGGVLGKMAVAAAPFGLAGNGIGAAMKVGAGIGFAEPVAGEQSLANIAKGTAQNTLTSGVLAGAGQKVSNMAGDFISRKVADLALRKSQNAARDQTINEALDAGLQIPPSSVNPTFANTVKESIAGKTATAQTFSNKNAEKFQGMARRSLGLEDDVPLTPQVFQARRDLAYEVGYKPVAELPAVNWDSAFVGKVQALSPASKGGAIKDPAQSKIDEIITDLTARGQWTGEQLIRDIQLLRNQSTLNFKSASMPGGDPGAQSLAHAQKKAAQALEELAERNIIHSGGDANAIKMFREARQYIAKTHTVENATLPGSGAFDPRKIPAKQMGKLTGELKLAAEFAKNFPKASQSEAQVAGPAVNQLSAYIKPFLSGTGGVVGSAVGGPVLGTALAAAPFVLPSAMRAQLASRGAQNALRELYQLGLPARMAGRLGQNAPVAGAVLGSYAFGQ